MRLGLVLHDGAFASAVASLVDIFATAEFIRPRVDSSIAEIELVVAASRRRVTATAGITIPASRTLQELDDLDLLIVPALGTISMADTEAALATRTARSVVRALRAVDPERTRIAAACTGVFSLAETGLLENRRATTTWFLTPMFRARYPNVAVDLDNTVVADGPFLTAGAAFAHIDLALTILRSISVELAQNVARLLLIDERPSHVSLAIYHYLEHDDPIVLAFERYVRSHLDQPFDAAEVAHEIGTSRRTLERRTQQTLGLSPLQIVHRLRLERADHLRRTTKLSADEVARRVGYTNAETLRALQRRRQL